MTKSTVRSGYSAACAFPTARLVKITAAKAAPCLVPMASSRIIAVSLFPGIPCYAGAHDLGLARATDQRGRLAIPYLGSLGALLMPGARVEIAEVLIQHPRWRRYGFGEMSGRGRQRSDHTNRNIPANSRIAPTI